MNVVNSVFPTPEQVEKTFKGPEEGPFIMVNLLKFKAQATYASGEAVSGRKAYARYGTRMTSLVEAHGGRLVYSGAVKGLMIGDVEELWDSVALMEYPSRAVFHAVMQLPEYHEIEEHRVAGLAGQLNIETRGR